MSRTDEVLSIPGCQESADALAAPWPLSNVARNSRCGSCERCKAEIADESAAQAKYVEAHKRALGW